MQISRRDSVTHLWNRQAYFEDCKHYKGRIKAIVSLDMNGLKEMNDIKGHKQGDLALYQIGKSMRECCDKKCLIYRIGGDELQILYLDGVGNAEQLISNKRCCRK